MLWLVCDLFENGKGNDALPCDKILYITDVLSATKAPVTNNDIVVFSVNEDGMHYAKSIKMTVLQIQEACVVVRNAILEKAPQVSIYNDPAHILSIGDKFKTYKQLQYTSPHIVPLFCDGKDAKSWSLFPCIVAAKVASGGRFRHLVNSKEDIAFKTRCITAAKGANGAFVSEYVHSYVEQLGFYINVRLMVVNDQVIDWFCRPGDTWNIHTKTQKKGSLATANEWYMQWVSHHENKQRVCDVVTSVHQTFGNGLYSIDCAIDKTRIAVCEVGYKIWDDTVAYKITEITKPTHNKTLYGSMLDSAIKGSVKKGKKELLL